MYLKLRKMDFFTPRLGLLTMLVLKSGKISHTTIKVIFGLWAVFYMR